MNSKDVKEKLTELFDKNLNKDIDKKSMGCKQIEKESPGKIWEILQEIKSKEELRKSPTKINILNQTYYQCV